MARNQTKLSRLVLNANRTDANAIATVPLIVKAVAGQTGDLQQWQDSAGAIWQRVGPSTSAFGIGLQFRVARAKYDFSVDGGGAPGLISLATTAVIPDDAIAIGGCINSIVAGAGVNATIAFGTSAGSAANSLKAATAVASFTTDALLAVVPLAAASFFKMTAAGEITMTTATTALTAGLFEITVWYIVAAG